MRPSCTTPSGHTLRWAIDSPAPEANGTKDLHSTSEAKKVPAVEKKNVRLRLLMADLEMPNSRISRMAKSTAKDGRLLAVGVQLWPVSAEWCGTGIGDYC
jgi:hypothetical protein